MLKRIINAGRVYKRKNNGATAEICSARFICAFLQATYGAVDLLIVGQFASSADVSAVSTGSQIMQTFTGLVSSFAVGITVFVGQKIGEGNAAESNRIIGAGIYLFAAIGIVMSLLVVVLAAPVAHIMQAPVEAFD